MTPMHVSAVKDCEYAGLEELFMQIQHISPRKRRKQTRLSRYSKRPLIPVFSPNNQSSRLSVEVPSLVAVGASMKGKDK